ncbi:MAG: GAF domain-containing protein, partial [Planctomycetes bacterium]|nr:GAF domain-containing protein [Planctomycetota bacterium]
YPMPIDRSVCGVAREMGQPLHFPHVAGRTDLTEDVEHILARHGDHSLLVAPMMKDGRSIGSIVVSRFPARPFSDKDTSLLSTFADQAVIAIENARLFRETNEALERQTALSEVLEVIGSSVEDPAPVFDKVLDSCHALIDCEELGLFVVREDGLVDLGAPWRGYAREGTREFLAASFPRPIEGTLVEIATRERRTLH